VAFYSRTTCLRLQATLLTSRSIIGASTFKQRRFLLLVSMVKLLCCSFVGSNQFCFKACDNSITNPDYCQNIYDTQGCGFNMPAAYAPGVFLSCLGDNQQAPGAAPVIPATSSCTTYSSSDLYPNVCAPSSAMTQSRHFFLQTATTSVTTTSAGKTSKTGPSSTGTSRTSAATSVFVLPPFCAILGVVVAMFTGMAIVF
jgi:hypothetical protein